MYTSSLWLNDYLDPPASATEQAELLTRCGFPLEGREELSGEDVRQDFEMSSNRGDCVSHYGLAREIAAISGRRLKPPEGSPKTSGPAAETFVRVTNHEPALCPRYTARVIRGVKVGPSPKWLASRLEAIGQHPRNNIVDASNFVLFEMGQPTHVFDLATLAGSEIVIRKARGGERMLPIGEGAQPVALGPDDLVIADADRPVAIAGVKGGAETAVGDTTTDVLIEAAAFDPYAVRCTSRRLGIASDSSYRFERGVHSGQVDEAAERLAAMIMENAGGTLAPGVVADGAPPPTPREVSMRIDRCRAIMGVEIAAERMIEWLEVLEFAPKHDRKAGVIRCVVPVHRLDIDREIDLIEEVGRMHGHDNLPVTETIQVRVAPVQSIELARQAVTSTLAGMGFVETVTHSLIDETQAAPFLLPGHEPLGVLDEPTVLRPSILPSLLRVQAHNRHNGVRDLELFEQASVFSLVEGEHREQPQLAMVMDLDGVESGLRPLRGVIERLIEMVLGPDVAVDVSPDEAAMWLAPGAVVRAGGEALGRLGLIEAGLGHRLGLEGPVAAAELEMPRFYEHFPPLTEASALPSFPAVERDISAIVESALPWSRVRELVDGLGLEHLETLEFVTSFSGRQIGRGRNSVTLRLRFRAPDRTLTHEEVDGPTGAVIGALEKNLGAEIRK
jgi:phenylalanyl-tRNA synthetase beta chain